MTSENPTGSKKKKKSAAAKLIWLVPICLFAVFLYSGYRFFNEYREYKAARDEYSSLSSLITDTEGGTGGSGSSTAGGLSGLMGNSVSARSIAEKLQSLEMESADALDLTGLTGLSGITGLPAAAGDDTGAAASSDPATSSDDGSTAEHTDGTGAGTAEDNSDSNTGSAAGSIAEGAKGSAAAGTGAQSAGTAGTSGQSAGSSGTASAGSADSSSAASGSGSAAALSKTDRIVYPRLQIDFDALQEINEDFVGVLYIPFLDIKYPIAHSHDNREYLRRTFEGSTNAAGCIFLEAFASEDLTDTNTFIFGHNMRDRSMFGSFNTLESDPDLCPQHPYFYVYMPGIVYKYSVFAYGPVSVQDPLYEFFDASDDPEAYDAFIEGSAARSIYTPEEGSIDFDSRPPLVTLSTCYGTGHINNFVIQGALKGAAPLRGSIRRAGD